MCSVQNRLYNVQNPDKIHSVQNPGKIYPVLNPRKIQSVQNPVKSMAINVQLSPDTSMSSPPMFSKKSSDEPMEIEPEKTKGYDQVDSPFTQCSEEVEVSKLFQTMRHEINRLNSFSEKWPLVYVRPADLAEAGFFYLQSDDKVQCAFCKIVMEKWVEGQKPLREHMRRSPKCPFLMSGDQNVPIIHHKPKSPVFTRPVGKLEKTPVIDSPYTPKYPRMADIKNRLASYREWPRIMLTPKQLAECGLYYTGIADIVTCYFCGGSLGNWEVDDDPWIEHEKFFPTCAFLRVKRNSGEIPQKPKPHGNATSYSNSVHREVIRQACEIFPKTLVEKVVFKRMSEGSQIFSSLQELCDDVLEMKAQESKPVIRPVEANQNTSSTLVYSNGITAESFSEPAKSKEIKDVLLCKICWDREREVLFQPCAHLVACLKCSEQLEDCPVCRKPIIHKVRTYLS